MKVKVLSFFEDQNTKGKFYKPGEVVDLRDSRAKSLIERKLAEEIKEEKSSKK